MRDALRRENLVTDSLLRSDVRFDAPPLRGFSLPSRPGAGYTPRVYRPIDAGESGSRGRGLGPLRSELARAERSLGEGRQRSIAPRLAGDAIHTAKPAALLAGHDARGPFRSEIALHDPHSLSVRDASTCKERPRDNRPKRGKAGGASREFIPWCDRRS